MLYCLKCAPILKKIFGADKVTTVSSKKLAEIITLDPATSDLDLLIVTNQDVRGFGGMPTIKVLEQKHEDIPVLYLCNNKKDIGLLDSVPNIIAYEDVHLNSAEEVESIVKEALGDTLVSAPTESEQIDRDITIVDRPSKLPTSKFPTPSTFKGAEQESPVENPATLVEEPTKTPLPDDVKEPEEVDVPEVEPAEELTAHDIAVQNEMQGPTIQERIERIKNYKDFDLLAKEIESEKVIRELVNASTNYAGAANMLDVLDRKMLNIFQDKSLDKEVRFEQIKAIGLERAGYKNAMNNELVQKLCSIITTIITVAENVCEERIREIEQSYNNPHQIDLFYRNQEEISALTRKRLDAAVELEEMKIQLVETYKTIDESARNTIASFKTGLPSSNAWINEVVSPVASLFTPEDSSRLTGEILEAVKNGRITLSAIEEKAKAVVKQLMILTDTSEEVLQKYDEFTRLLIAQRVEDKVFVDTALKSCMRTFAGALGSGTHTTALAYAGLLQRKGNVLVLDFWDTDYEQHGYTPIDWETFVSQDPKDDLCIVKVPPSVALDDDFEDAFTLIQTRLTHYKYVVGITDLLNVPLVNRLGKYSLCLHYVVNSTARSIQLLKNTLNAIDTENIGVKLVCIAPPMGLPELCMTVGLDPLTTKLIAIPHSPEVCACSLRNIAVATIPVLRQMYEHALF